MSKIELENHKKKANLNKHTDQDLHSALTHLNSIKHTRDSINHIALKKMLTLQEGLGAFKLANQKLQNELEQLKNSEDNNSNILALEANIALKKMLELQETLNSTNLENRDLKNKLRLIKNSSLTKTSTNHLELENKITRKKMLQLQEALIESKVNIHQLNTEISSLKAASASNISPLNTQFELNNKIMLNAMLNTQEKLNSCELDNKNLKAEISNLRNNTHNLNHVSQLDLENKKLKAELDLLKNNAIDKNKIALLEKQNQIAFKKLLNVQEKLSEYKIENQNLKNKINIQKNESILTFEHNTTVTQSPNTLLLGASTRVKNELPYQIGKTMIDCSKNLNDSIKMPFIIYEKIRNEEVKEKSDDLPPISQYSDAQDAEKIKNHLSYRLGKVVISSMNNSKDILRLPLKIGVEILKFKLKN